LYEHYKHTTIGYIFYTQSQFIEPTSTTNARSCLGLFAIHSSKSHYKHTIILIHKSFSLWELYTYEHAYSQFIQTISNRNSETHVLTSALQPRTLITRTPRFYSICCNTCVDRKCHREVAKLDVYSKYVIHSRCYAFIP